MPRCTHPLKKAKVRQSWNKYNLYNLSRITLPPYKGRTFFQQKWTAKSTLRAYHGEQVRESQWTRMFTRRIRSVVPMNAEYLAINDGQVESGGRGSGAETARSRGRASQTPYMQMTFAPLERRIDTAIFRAMFASSARQARQFVIHGAVRVNGKKMRYPGYLLNPGDMFQVAPERVMFATGAPKASLKPAEEAATPDEADISQEASSAKEPIEEQEVEDGREPRDVLRELLSEAKSVLSASRDDISAKRKQDLRAFSKSVRRMLSKSRSTTIFTDSLEAQFQEIQHQLRIQRDQKETGKASLPAAQTQNPTETDQQPAVLSTRLSEPSDPDTSEPTNTHLTITDTDSDALFAALIEMTENPVDDSKPYATPWTPRDYMSAFAFIPRYLEVNPNVCAAVYLRHPVARPGAAEVPSPFAESTAGGAFAWYLRRR